MTTTPQDHRPPVRKVTKRNEAKQDDDLDRGISFVDDDGTTLSVRVRDVKGKHDAALVAATGLDFMALLAALTIRQGLDLLAAVVWFGRLVNGRDAGTYAATLEDFGYEDVLRLDLDDAKEQSGPEA